MNWNSVWRNVGDPPEPIPTAARCSHHQRQWRCGERTQLVHGVLHTDACCRMPTCCLLSYLLLCLQDGPRIASACTSYEALYMQSGCRWLRAKQSRAAERLGNCQPPCSSQLQACNSSLVIISALQAPLEHDSSALPHHALHTLCTWPSWSNRS